MMCETLHKQDSKKKQTLKYLVDCTLNYKFSVQPVIGKSSKCLSLLRNPVCWSYVLICWSPNDVDVLMMLISWSTSRCVIFQSVSTTSKGRVFQLIYDRLTLFSRRFCSSDNCYCFFWISYKLEIKQSATELSQWLFTSLTYCLIRSFKKIESCLVIAT